MDEAGKIWVDLLGWSEAFNAIKAMKIAIRECAANGPAEMLEVLGNYISAVDAADDETGKDFDAAMKRVEKLS